MSKKGKKRGKSCANAKTTFIKAPGENGRAHLKEQILLIVGGRTRGLLSYWTV